MEKKLPVIMIRRAYPSTSGVMAYMICSMFWSYYGAVICSADRVETGFGWFVIGLPWIIFAVDVLRNITCKMTMELEGIRITWFGRTVRWIPAEKMGLICVAGGTYSRNICIGECSLDELTDLQVKRMQKSPLQRPGLSWQMSVPGWKKRFAKDYVNRMRWRPLSFLVDSGFFFLNMDQGMLELLRQYYPQVIFETLADKQIQSGTGRRDRVPLYSLVMTDRIAALIQPDGIHILRKGEPYWNFPKEKIRTVAKVEFSYSRGNYCYYDTLLVVSALTVEQMAENGKLAMQIQGDSLLNYPWGRAIAADQYCLQRIGRWKGEGDDFCAMYHTMERQRLLIKLCPDAQWLDLDGGCYGDTYQK